MVPPPAGSIHITGTVGCRYLLPGEPLGWTAASAAATDRRQLQAAGGVTAV